MPSRNEELNEAAHAFTHATVAQLAAILKVLRHPDTRYLARHHVFDLTEDEELQFKTFLENNSEKKS